MNIRIKQRLVEQIIEDLGYILHVRKLAHSILYKDFFFSAVKFKISSEFHFFFFF